MPNDSDARFAGFPPEAISFYEDLALENTREFWLANRRIWERAIRDPMRALVAELDPDPGAFHMFRPNRDVRFSADKSPYKNHQGAAATSPGRSVRYVQISADGLFVASGCHMPTPDQLTRLRDGIADDTAGAALDAALAVADEAGLEAGGGGQPDVATAPRGWPRDHPRIALLRRRGMVVSETILDPGVLETREALERVRASWEAGAPLRDWLDRHVGPSTAPPRGRRG